MLQIAALQVGYGTGTVLEAVDLRVDAGSVQAIVGHNGAGKTTLLHTIAGLHRPRRGRIRFFARDVTRWPAHRRVRAGIALVPQGRRVFASLTVAEHLAIATRPLPHQISGPAWTRARVLELLPPLAARLSHRGAQLSGGEQQMLAIARALLTQPRLLLLDEPTEGLAPALVAQIRDLIGQLAMHDLTVLLAASGPDPLAALADQVAVLAAGKLSPAPLAPTAPTQPTNVEARNP